MKTIKRILSASAALIISLQFANAQYTVKGTVKDNETSQPIPGAAVSVPHTTIATSADAQGMFTLQSPANFDSISITSIGYAAQTIAVGDKSQSITVMLKVSSNELSEAQVLGIKKAQTVNTLTQADLNRTSGLKLQDALNDVPGVDMQARTQWGGQRITIRGYIPNVGLSMNFNGLGYQMYIDNIPVTDATGMTVMDDIDFSTLGKVEIYKGPTPLYGSYIAGAVNLYTPVVNETSIQEQAIGGSYGLFRTNTTINVAGTNSGIYINYGHQTYGGFRMNDNSLKDFITFAGQFKPSSKQSVSTFISYSHSVEHLAGEIDSAAFYKRNIDSVNNSFYALNTSMVEIESFRAGVTDKFQFCKGFSNQSTLFTTSNTLNQPFAHGFTKDINLSFGGRTAFMYENVSDKLTVDGTLGFSFEKTNQMIQGDFILPFIANSPFTSSTGGMIPSDAQNYAMNYAIFTNWNFKLPSQITFTLGGSLNFQEFGTQNYYTSAFSQYTGNPGFLPFTSNGVYLNYPQFTKPFAPVFTPSASVIKVFSDNVSVYASVSEGYSPALISEMTNSLGKVDSALKPESAMQYEIGTKGTVMNHKLSYQLALFDMDITNRLIQENNNGISFYTNAGEQRNIGAELYLAFNAINNKDGAITMLRPWISYTYSNFKYVDFKVYGASKSGGDTVLNDYSGNKAVGVAPNVFNLGIDFATKAGFYVNVKFQYVDKVPVTFDNGSSAEAYSLLGAKIGYMKKIGTHFSVDAFVGADNLTNSTYYTFLFYGANIKSLAQTPDGGSGDGYILPAPFLSTYYGGLTLKYTF